MAAISTISGREGGSVGAGASFCVPPITRSDISRGPERSLDQRYFDGDLTLPEELRHLVPLAASHHDPEPKGCSTDAERIFHSYEEGSKEDGTRLRETLSKISSLIRNKFFSRNKKDKASDETMSHIGMLEEVSSMDGDVQTKMMETLSCLRKLLEEKFSKYQKVQDIAGVVMETKNSIADFPVSRKAFVTMKSLKDVLSLVLNLAKRDFGCKERRILNCRAAFESCKELSKRVDDSDEAMPLIDLYEALIESCLSAEETTIALKKMKALPESRTLFSLLKKKDSYAQEVVLSLSTLKARVRHRFISKKFLKPLEKKRNNLLKRLLNETTKVQWSLTAAFCYSGSSLAASSISASEMNKLLLMIGDFLEEVIQIKFTEPLKCRKRKFLKIQGLLRGVEEEVKKLQGKERRVEVIRACIPLMQIMIDIEKTTNALMENDGDTGSGLRPSVATSSSSSAAAASASSSSAAVSASSSAAAASASSSSAAGAASSTTFASAACLSADPERGKRFRLPEEARLPAELASSSKR